MGYIAAALNRNGEDASTVIDRILRQAGGVKDVYYGYASHNQAEHHARLPDLLSVTSDTVIGYKAVNPKDYPPQPLTQRSGSLCLNAAFIGGSQPATLAAANLLMDDPLVGFRKLMASPGHHTAVHISPGRILCSRDPVGTQPLYIAENSEFCMAASNKKMLWSLGLRPVPLKPGHIVSMTATGVHDFEVATLQRPEPLEDASEAILEKLDRILMEVARDASRWIPRGALAFSGGIDSTLTALYMSESGVDLDLICVGIDARKEYMQAQAAADGLGMDLQIRQVTLKELEEAVPEIIRSVEDNDPLQVGVAAPLYFVAKSALEQGHETVLTGGGSDEVFGGYYKYHSAYLENPAAAAEMMFLDASQSWVTNYDRDAKTCIDLGLNLLQLFTHPRVIDYGLSIPVELKLPKEMNKPRKAILRRLGQKHGLPEDAWAWPKKAAQYSTGVHRAMERLAKSRGHSLRGYLHDIYEEIRREYADE
jgi:asparagine synthase (glutamine-hydrolysing)